MTPCRPIDVVVQSWCGDAVAVVAVDGEVNADSCAALATAVAQAARTTDDTHGHPERVDDQTGLPVDLSTSARSPDR